MSKQGKRKDTGHKVTPPGHLFQKEEHIISMRNVDLLYGMVLEEGWGSATSFAISCGGTGGIPEPRKGRYPLWPEWNESDVNSEKWDAGKGKEKDKSSKSPNVHLFDDPEGKNEIPVSLMVHTWKRPHEFLVDRIPVVIENEIWFDLIPESRHAMASELMRSIIADITSLWKICNSSSNEKTSTPPESPFSWKPWEHIYSLCKAVKGHMPLYNSYGKYVVKLFWMGCWRKIIVDDTMPFDQHDNLLLPATTQSTELWPMLLSKALVKIASIDMNADGSRELGDFTVVHALTGWNPEIIPINKKYTDKIWSLLLQIVPEFKLPPDEISEIKLSEIDSLLKDVKEIEVKDESLIMNKITDKVAKGPEKLEVKDSNKKKSREIEKDKNKATYHVGKPIPQSSITESSSIPTIPQMVVYAGYSQFRHTFLGKMGESSEMLRYYGLSNLYSHSVMISRTRSCPLQPLPKPPVIPRWKLIRPRKHILPSAEPKEFIEKKPDQFVEIASPFIHELPEIANLHLNIQKSISSNGILLPVAESSELLDVFESDVELVFPEPSKDPEPMKANSKYPIPFSKPKIEPYKERRLETIRSTSQISNTPLENKIRKDSMAEPRELALEPIKSQSQNTNIFLDSRRGSSADVNKELGIDVLPSNTQIGSPSYNLTKIQWNYTFDVKDDNVPARIKELSTRVSNTSLTNDGRLLVQQGSRTLNVFPESEMNMIMEKKPIGKQTWVDYDDFCKCFQKLVIFHKPNTYPFTAQRSDMKSIDERGAYYLFVDNMKPTEILVTFSALVRWGDINCERLPSKDKLGKGMNDNLFFKEDQKESSNLVAGLLLAEPYSWTSLISNAPILYMHTYATKSVMLMLPEGRHVLRFTPSSPLGHHIHLSSTVPFTFGEEETILSNLGKESQQFVHQAQKIMKALGNVFNSFGDEQEIAKAEMELMTAHVPPKVGKGQMLEEHMQNFQNALYATLALALRESYVLHDLFAVRVITKDFKVRNVLAETLNYVEETYDVPPMWRSRKPTDIEEKAATKIQAFCRGCFIRSLLAARIPGTKENEIVKDSLQRNWLTLEPNANQHGLILLRHIFKAKPQIAANYQCAADEWTKAVYADYVTSYSDQLSNCWFVPFREVFYVTEDVLIVPKVYSSIPICALHIVDNDTGKEIPKVFQKIAPFLCTKNTKGYTFVAEARSLSLPLPSGKWKLRLIGCHMPLPTPAKELNSNFSVREIKDYYVTNEKCVIFRYQIKVMANHMVTIQAQTSKPEVYIRLLILNKEKPVAETTGRGQAIIPAYTFLKNARLSITHSSSSKNQYVLNPIQTMKKVRTNSGVNMKPGRISPRTVIGQTSKVSVEDDVVAIPIAIEKEIIAEEEVHKYIIQGIVLHNSWTLTKNEMAFVEEMKNLEKNEIKVFGQKVEEQPSAAVVMDVRPSFESRISKKSKGGKEKVISRPESRLNQLDINKPHYTIHIVSDQNEVDKIEIKKDTERVDEIRSMKQAWEDAEPGRALKAMQSRLKYLGESESVEYDNIEIFSDIPLEGVPEEEIDDLAEEITETDELNEKTEESKDMIGTDAQMSNENALLSPSIFGTTNSLQLNVQNGQQTSASSEPAQKDEKSIVDLDQVTQIQQFRKIREAMLERREREQNARMKLQLRQLDTYENLQAKLDEARKAVFKQREAYRSKLIEAEAKRQQEIAAKEADLLSDQEKKSAMSKKKSSSESKSIGKKKKK